MKKIIALLVLCLPWIAKSQSVFSDDFTNGLTQWQNTTGYTIANAELRLNATAAGASHIVAPTPLRDSVSWEFYWRTELLPSSTNQAQIVLQADNANLSGTFNGYYIQIGESNADFIRLYKKTGTTATLLATSTLSFPSAPTRNIAARMRVTRNANGAWQMFADTTGANNLTLQATATDNTYNTGSYFGFNCKYTTTNLTKFVFDDVRVAPLFVDATPPSLISATATSGTTVDVLFSEPLTAASANTTANYSLSNGGVVTNATQDATDLALVHLTVQALVSNTTYTLTTSGLRDAANNASSAQTTTFSYVNVAAAAPEDVVINEIMADVNPTVGLPAVEWLELYNRSNKYINANTLQIKTGSSTLQTLPSAVLAPNSYTIITKTGNETSLTAYGTVLGVASFSLTDAGATVLLQDVNTTIINSVTYSDAWYNDATKKAGGWSLELKNPQLLCIGANNWTASNDVSGGTPGRQNTTFSNTPDTQSPTITSAVALTATTVQVVFSENITDATSLSANNFSVSNGGGVATTINIISGNTVVLTFVNPLLGYTPLTLTATTLRDCSGNTTTNATAIFTYTPTVAAANLDILINEIMADVNPTVGLPAVEWIELYNRSNKYINANSLQLKTGSGSLQALPNAVLTPNSYTIITKTGNETALSAFGTVLGVTSFSLTDAGAAIVLQDTAANNINSVTYSDGWYNNPSKDDGGWSLERKNPLQPCATTGNWTASNDASGGTPGRQNSTFDNTPDTQAPTIAQATALDANTIEVRFSEPLLDGVSLSANNFSVNNGVGVATAATIVDETTLNLTFAALPPNVVVTITATNLRDCSGNNRANATATCKYRPTQAATRYDILINEIFPDNSNPLGIPAQEYIELYNRSNKNIQLQGMMLLSGDSDCALPFYVLEPNSYVIITNTDGADFSSFGTALALSDFISLSNPTATSGDDIRLLNTNSTTIDAINYDKTWWKGSATTKALERVNPMMPCNEADNWAASTSNFGGTPGTQNSTFQNVADTNAPAITRAIVQNPSTIVVYFNEALSTNITASMFTLNNNIGQPTAAGLDAIYFNAVTLYIAQPLQPSVIYTLSLSANVQDCMGNNIAANSTAKVVLPSVPAPKDLVINEILHRPKSGGVQFVEIYNRSQKVIDLKDFIIAARSTDTTERISTNYLLFPDDYVVLTENDFILQQQNNVPNPNKILQVLLPQLSYSGDSFFLLSNGLVIDSLAYTEDWHTPLLPTGGNSGISLERINPDGFTNNGNNWHSAAQSVGFATPTYRNSQYFKGSGIDNGEVSVEPATFSPDADGFEDFTQIIFKDGMPGYIVTATIFDAQGRPVRSLAKTQLLGTADVLLWDGTYTTGEKAPIGIYVVAISMFNPNGDVKAFKKTVVLASKL